VDEYLAEVPDGAEDHSDLRAHLLEEERVAAPVRGPSGVEDHSGLRERPVEQLAEGQTVAQETAEDHSDLRAHLLEEERVAAPVRGPSGVEDHSDLRAHPVEG